MKVVQINTFPHKATGSIMMNLHRYMCSEGIVSYVVWGRGRKSENEKEIVISDAPGVILHGIYTRITDKTGFASQRATKILIGKLREIRPDIIHLHNIHGYYINLDMLFQFIKENDIQVVWTLHDCWTFTGHCAFFDENKCLKWEEGCYRCEQKKEYPASFLLDNSKLNYAKKKELFTGLHATLVTPCKWLDKLTKRSFLKDYPVEVIYNGIDTDLFRPVDGTNFRKKNNLEGKTIILGVASEWTKRKGLRDFIVLSSRISRQYKIILVGLSAQQLKEIPAEILGLKRTNNVQELIELYSTADVFVNPTYEDNFPTTNLEALACGTPVIAYDTGGCGECISDEGGKLIPRGDLDALYRSIIEFDGAAYKGDVCRNQVITRFDKKSMISKYVQLYERLLKRNEDGN